MADLVLSSSDRVVAWANRLREIARKNGGVTVEKEEEDGSVVTFRVNPDDKPQTIHENYISEKGKMKKPRVRLQRPAEWIHDGERSPS